MKIIPLEQGSPEWLSFRRKRIMATDISSIIGSNPWSDAQNVYDEKFQLIPAKEQNDRMKRGQELEPLVRAQFIEEFDLTMQPCVVQHSEFFWAAASLDGISDCNRYLLEIKCPNLKTHKDAMEGELMPYYYSQMQWQLFVSGAEKVFYRSFNDESEEKYIVILVDRNEEYIEECKKVALNFYENHMLKMEPPIKIFQQKKST